MEIKRKYYFLRQGWQIIAPIFGFSNTLMLIYLTLKLDEMNVPLYLFAPSMAIIIAIVLIFAGKIFRDRQQETDVNLVYFKATEAIRSTLVMYDALLMLLESQNLKDTEQYNLLNNRKKILKGATEGKP